MYVDVLEDGTGSIFRLKYGYVLPANLNDGTITLEIS